MMYIFKLLLPLLINITLIKCLEDVRTQVLDKVLKNPEDVVHRNNTFMHVAAIACDLTLPADLSKPSMVVHLERFTRSMLKYSMGNSIHLIFLTDKKTQTTLEATVIEAVGKVLSEMAIRGRDLDREFFDAPSHKHKFPKLFRNGCYFINKSKKTVVEFVDLAVIVDRHKEDIENLKTYFGTDYKKDLMFKRDGVTYVPMQKYHKETFCSQFDLYYVGPFYADEFPKDLELLMVLDIDLEIRTDLYYLLRHAEDMNSSQIMAVTPDLSPFYYISTKKFRESNPESEVGMIGGLQGLNTGVVIYDLPRFRNSSVMKKFLKEENMKMLKEKYFKGAVGDQDFFMQVLWEAPELFYRLSCQFNYQTYVNKFGLEEYYEKLERFKDCPNPIYIYHHNGKLYV